MSLNHLAIIMDGNGRWAKKRGHPRVFGHIRGATALRAIVTECTKLGMGYLTLYAFSTENWGRPTDEVQLLMKLLCKYLLRQQKTLLKQNIRFCAIGDLDKLPVIAKKIVLDTIQKTSHNTGLCMTFALSYGSRQEITKVVQAAAREVQSGKLDPAQITEDYINSHLFTQDMPDPDMIIRTSGELRLSNFLLWQAAYSEIYVTPKLWPEFKPADLHEALEDYDKRHRRFGLTREQVDTSTL